MLEPRVSSQRNDRQDKYDRNKAPQDTPVNMTMEGNVQACIDMERKRLCNQAAPETRAYAEDLKVMVHEREPEIADAFVKPCIRCGACPEINNCGWWETFLARHPEIDIHTDNIIIALEGHTMAVELVSKQMKLNNISTETMYQKLCEKGIYADDNKIKNLKDGSLKNKTAYVTFLCSLHGTPKGTAYQLHKDYLEYSKTKGMVFSRLEVLKTNAHARAFYERQGYRTIEDHGKKDFLQLKLQ